MSSENYYQCIIIHVWMFYIYQKLDWSLHKVECKGIARITPNVPTNTIRLLVRLLAKKTMRHESKVCELIC